MTDENMLLLVDEAHQVFANCDSGFLYHLLKTATSCAAVFLSTTSGLDLKGVTPKELRQHAFWFHRPCDSDGVVDYTERVLESKKCSHLSGKVIAQALGYHAGLVEWYLKALLLKNEQEVKFCSFQVYAQLFEARIVRGGNGNLVQGTPHAELLSGVFGSGKRSFVWDNLDPDWKQMLQVGLLSPSSCSVPDKDHGQACLQKLYPDQPVEYTWTTPLQWEYVLRCIEPPPLKSLRPPGSALTAIDVMLFTLPRFFTGALMSNMHRARSKTGFTEYHMQRAFVEAASGTSEFFFYQRSRSSSNNEERPW